MFKKVFVLLLIIAILTGCSTQIENPPRTPEETGGAAQKEQGPRDAVSAEHPAQEEQNSDWVMIPVGDQSEESRDQQQPSANVLLNQEQAVRMFLDAWEQNDLEKMNMLTFDPLEDFFRHSNLSFASYGYLDMGDLGAFVRDGLGKLRANEIDSFAGAKIENFLPNGDRLTASLGNVLSLNFSLILDRNMWKLKSMDAVAYGFQEAIPNDWDSLGRTVLVDIKDMNGSGSYELLGMGLWSEWEEIGPEPSSAIGIYTYSDGQLNGLYYRDISQRFESGRVVIEGGMGNLAGAPTFTLVFIEKTAEDILRIADSLEVEYYISLYGFDGENIEKVEDIDWKGIVCNVLDDGITPEWVELLGVKRFKEKARESLVLRVGLTGDRDSDNNFSMNEGIFVISSSEGEWDIDWYHVGTYGEYHTVVFEQTVSDADALKMYYIEDVFDEAAGGSVFEVFYDGRRWRENKLFSSKLDIKAVGDMDGDGTNEFLVLDGSSLQVHSRTGEVLWRVSLPASTKEVPHAFIGSAEGKQKVVATLHMGDYTDWTSHIYLWEGQGYQLEKTWESEPLGSNGISAMKVWDIDRDGKPEILANFSNDYLQPGEFFKIFEP